MKYESIKFFGAFGTVYTLSDREHNIFYVGSTTRPLNSRLAGHLAEAKYFGKYIWKNKKKNELIRELNYEILISPLESKWVTGPKWATAQNKLVPLERKWIEVCKSAGVDLCNIHLLP